MKKEITVESLFAAFDKGVAERGADWTYPIEDEDWGHEDGGCRYFLDDGSPACIVGYALAEHGYGPGDAVEGRDAHLVLLVLGASEEVATVAVEVQLDQDDGMPWGVAVQKARKYYKEASK